MTFALFDLDNTLLSIDSDYTWGQFLVAKGIVDQAHYEKENLRFFEDYKQGTLDIYAYSAFAFEPLTRLPYEQLLTLRNAFMAEKILPAITQKARAQVEYHREQQHTLVVITATNSFVTRPIADEFGIEHLIATEPLMVDGQFTQLIDGTPCFQDGKVQRLQQWVQAQQVAAYDNSATTINPTTLSQQVLSTHYLAGSYFYSDSRNDLPLLEQVDHPFAVDPDNTLHQIATERGWPILSFRE
ncbi:MAG TPA: HAD family hydrolase [Thiothrix sp.]|nr:HAD family hydrolase [Thiothrix sp.]